MQNAADVGDANSKIGLKEMYIPNVGGGGKWYLNQDCKIYGPMSWDRLKSKANGAEISPNAQIREENWVRWITIMAYFRFKTQEEKELDALIPGENDAMFYLGIIMFFIGVFGFIIMPIIGIVVLIVSPIVEGLALYNEFTSKERTVVGTIGNVMLIIWMVIQIIATIILVSAYWIMGGGLF